MPSTKFNDLQIKKHENCNIGKNIRKMYNYLINLNYDFAVLNELNDST